MGYFMTPNAQPSGETAKRLLMQVLSQPEESRHAFLSAACAGDKALHAEVESLLACHTEGESPALSDVPRPSPQIAETASYSIEPSRDEPRTQLQPHAGTQSAEKQPKEISWDAVLETAHESGGFVAPGAAFQVASLLNSRYEVLEEIGSGGMGLVYRGRHRKLGMDVAIKVLKQGASADRFLREARTLAQLKSPHVVRIHDFEILDSGMPILVMEWVEGSDLHQMMRDYGGRVSEQYALPWMRDVCAGMMLAAGEGIIHRDLKPSNILIDKRNQARVADFGLARNPRKTGDASVVGNVLGTPQYMAPEQAEDPLGVDTRADIYSFGATFYHVLTGFPPFSGKTPFSILFKHKTEPLVSPKARFSAISERVNAILERCLAKSPADRFQSFAMLLRQLESSANEKSPWNDTDEDDLAPYLAQYQARRDSYFAEPRSTSLSDTYQFPDGRSIRILVGDIVAQEVDAIVSSDGGFLQMTEGVARSIKDAAGEQIQAEAKRFAPVRPGRAIVTSGGALKARFVFHGITMGFSGDRLFLPSPDIISEILASCFYHADTLDVASIAFPLLGTGAGGFPQGVCLDKLFRFLTRAFLRGMTCVREARIVLFPGDAQRSQTVISHKTGGLTEPSPQIRGYSFFSSYQPATQVGGDYYDFIPLTNGRIAVVLAERSGHGNGIGTLIFMRQLAVELKHCLESETTLSAAVTSLNDWLVREYPGARFVTMVIAVLDPNRHQITLVNAGHFPPLIRRSDHDSYRFEDADNQLSGLPLGISSELPYAEAGHFIGPGDLFVLYSGGISEAMGEKGEFYGIDRLRRVAIKAGVRSKAVGEAIVADVAQFVAATTLGDDQTLLIFGRDE